MTHRLQPYADQLAALFRDLSEHLVTAVKVSDDDPSQLEMEVIFKGSPYVCITIGWPVTVRTITGDIKVPGFRVYYIKVHPGSRWDPPEEEDVTLAEARTVADAFTSAVSAIASTMARY